MTNETRNTEEYILNFHRIRKRGDKILLITEQGAWAALDKKTYDRILRHDIDSKTYKELEARSIILTGQNSDSVVNSEFRRKHFLFYPPSLHIIIPTLRCNHQCIYCHSSAKISGKEFDMTPETAKKTIEFILSSPQKKLTIEMQGGEGLLNLELVKQLHDYSKELARKQGKEVNFTMVTNAILLTEETIDWAKANNVRLTTSLDGPEHIHNKNRIALDKKETHNRVIEKIELCRKKGIQIGALMVTTRNSLPYPEEIVDEYINRGFSMIQIKYLNKLGFAEKEWSETGYTADEYLTFWKRAMEHIIKRNKEGKKIFERITQIMLKKVLRGFEPGFLDLRNPCGTAIGQIAYGHDGNIYSCDEGRGFDIFKLGNVHNTTFEEYIKSRKTQELVTSTILENTLCDACVYKPYCGNCPVMNYAEQGNIIPKIATSTRCRIMKGQLDWIFDKIIEDKEARDVLSGWVSDG